MKKFRFLAALVVLACLPGSSRLWASACSQWNVTNFQLNPALILEMAKVAQQNSNTLNSYPVDMNPNVLSMMVTNLTGVDVEAYIRISIADDTGVCAGSPSNGKIVSGCPIITKAQLVNGVPTRLDASSFATGAGFTGDFCQAFVDAEQAKIGGGDSSNGGSEPDSAAVQAEVTRLMTHHFTVIVEIMDSSCSTVYCTASTQFSLLLGSPGSDCSIALPINPIDMGINGLPLFIWVPCRSTKYSSGEVSHRLELLESLDSQNPLTSVSVPGSTSSYQWKSSDYALEKGKKYYWRVLCIGPDGAPFCGPGNTGASIKKWFILNSFGAGSAFNSAGDWTCLWNFVKPRMNQTVADSLKGLAPASATISNGNMGMAELCNNLNTGKWTIQSVDFTKQ